MANHRRRQRTVVRLAIGALLSAAVSALSGQTLKGTILGTITDSSQAVVSGAHISVTEVNTNFHRAEIASEEGFYVFANLDPGTYRIEVQHPGFRKMIRAGIDLTPNSTARIDLELTPGALSEVIDVTADAPLLQTDRADTGGKIEAQQLGTMPLLNNRNYQNLLLVVPGVQRAYRSNSAFFNSQEHLQSVVNGLDQRNNYMIEGVDNNVENLTGIIPPADAIATVDVSTTNYDPELGRAGGAVTNVTLKSGTNALHGTAFEYHRNNNLQARNVFANATPQRLQPVRRQSGRPCDQR
jgi:Carboxypeptidase regulatory-like domain